MNRILIEVLGLWLVVNLLIRGVRMAWQDLGVHEAVLVLVPVLFLYTPALVCRWRGVDPWTYPIGLPSFATPAPWKSGVGWAVAWMLVTFPPFALAYHLWQTALFGREMGGAWPEDAVLLAAYHLLFVALPEEVFYRGYLQSRLDELWPPRWRLLGVVVGPGALLATVLFAFGHSIVLYQPWHAAIVVPGLAFAWLRIRTGDVLGGALYHAGCNVLATWLDVAYGVAPPG